MCLVKHIYLNLLNLILTDHCRYTKKIFSLLLFFYWWSSTVVYIFTLPLLPAPPIPTSHPVSPLGLSMCPLYKFLDGPFPISPIVPSPLPLWLLSVCSLFQCLWLYFAFLFVLLILKFCIYFASANLVSSLRIHLSFSKYMIT